MTGLEALESIIETFYNKESEDIQIVRKELKALNVFRKLMFFDVRTDNENGKMIYLIVWNAVAICRISKEEYELLKEVLK